MANKIIFLRHGQSTGNSRDVEYHYPDSCICLTALGVKQVIHGASQIKPLLGPWYLNWLGGTGVHVFTSEYTRAQQTARIFLDVLGLKHIQPHVRPQLNERNHHDPTNESFDQIKRRFKMWFTSEAESLASENDILIIAHGEFLMSAQSELIDADPYKCPSRNAVPLIYMNKNLIRYAPSIVITNHHSKKILRYMMRSQRM